MLEKELERLNLPIATADPQIFEDVAEEVLDMKKYNTLYVK